ncbi:hypothetical protein ACFOYW_17135 [Gryllotalpicola reticulitermitis]|uniref:Lipoprotein n=1 Tax=Gryllotalpicola reticulitermitis TaxID=1184153 RepID=A0ABV8QDM8_9MICO
MRILGRCLIATTTLLLAATLAGCTPAPTSSPMPRAASPTATSTPTPSSTPVFASDEEALAAAVAIYRKYEAASDAVGRDGGAHPERVRPYVSDSGYEFELAQAETLRAEQSHGVGAAVLNNAVLKSRDEQGGVATVTMHVCEDISAVDRIDAQGRSLVESTRGDYLDYEVVLKGSVRDGLVIHSNREWTGGGICKF